MCPIRRCLTAPFTAAETAEDIMRRLYRAEPATAEGARSLPRPRSAELRKPAGPLRQRVLRVAAEQRPPPPGGGEWREGKAQLLAALRGRGPIAGGAFRLRKCQRA